MDAFTLAIHSVISLVTSPYGKVILKTIFGYWVYSAVVTNLPAPTDKSSVAYRVVYGTLHSLASNFNQVAAALKVPGSDGNKG